MEEHFANVPTNSHFDHGYSRNEKENQPQVDTNNGGPNFNSVQNEQQNPQHSVYPTPLILYELSENGDLVPYTFSQENRSSESVQTNTSTINNALNIEKEGTISNDSQSPSKRYISIKLATDMVPVFDGKTPSIMTFIRACKSAENSVHPGDRTFLVTLIRNKIIGSADLYLQNNIEYDCLDTLLNALKLAFSPQWDLSQLQAQISNVIQKENESVLLYGIRVSELLRRTLESIDEGFPKEAVAGMRLGANKNAVSCFVRGLKEKIESRMQNKNPNNLQDAINTAVAVENEIECLSHLRNTRTFTRKDLSQRSHPYIRDTPRDTYEQRRVYKLEGSRNIPDINFKNNIKCFNCGKPGHYKRNCFKRQSPYQNLNPRKVIGRCGFCQGPNHYEENCFAKKEYEIRENTNFSKGPHRVKEKENRHLPSTSNPKPSGSKHVGSFAPSNTQK